MVEIRTVYTRLSKQEQRKLSSLIIGYGALKTCVDVSGINKNTLKRAKDGLTITPETAACIRKKLLFKENVAA